MRIYILLLLMVIAVTSCETYNEIPSPDEFYRNCIAVKIGVKVPVIPKDDSSNYDEVYFVNSKGKVFIAKSYSADGYYYLTNIPPDTYYISYAEYYTYDEDNWKQKYGDKRKYYYYHYFDNEFKEISKTQIQNNEFKFIGFYKVQLKLKLSQFVLSLFTDRVDAIFGSDSKMKIKTSLISSITDESDFKEYYFHIYEKLQNTPWAQLVKTKIDSM